MNDNNLKFEGSNWSLVDQFMDYVPFVSIITNAIDQGMKIKGIAKEKLQEAKNPVSPPTTPIKQHYWTHIENKSGWRLVFGCIPAIGNAILLGADLFRGIKYLAVRWNPESLEKYKEKDPDFQRDFMLTVTDPNDRKKYKKHLAGAVRNKFFPDEQDSVQGGGETNTNSANSKKNALTENRLKLMQDKSLWDALKSTILNLPRYNYSISLLRKQEQATRVQLLNEIDLFLKKDHKFVKSEEIKEIALKLDYFGLIPGTLTLDKFIVCIEEDKGSLQVLFTQNRERRLAKESELEKKDNPPITKEKHKIELKGKKQQELEKKKQQELEKKKQQELEKKEELKKKEKLENQKRQELEKQELEKQEKEKLQKLQELENQKRQELENQKRQELEKLKKKEELEKQNNIQQKKEKAQLEQTRKAEKECSGKWMYFICYISEDLKKFDFSILKNDDDLKSKQLALDSLVLYSFPNIPYELFQDVMNYGHWKNIPIDQLIKMDLKKIKNPKVALEAIFDLKRSTKFHGESVPIIIELAIKYKIIQNEYYADRFTADQIKQIDFSKLSNEEKATVSKALFRKPQYDWGNEVNKFFSALSSTQIEHFKDYIIIDNKFNPWAECISFEAILGTPDKIKKELFHKVYDGLKSMYGEFWKQDPRYKKLSEEKQKEVHEIFKYFRNL